MRRFLVLVLMATLLVLAPNAPVRADGNEAPGAPEAFRSLSAGYLHTCALRYDGGVRCWGSNTWGQLGLGDTAARGNEPGEMADALPTVDLGTGRTATAIAVGQNHTCALLDDGTVKCWGRNTDGRLGLGDTAGRGDGPGEMGDALPAVDLGTGRTATAITAGDTHTCALLDDASVKCWGDNWSGQLGLGDTADRGDGPGEMGDALPAVDLGGRTPTVVSGNSDGACVVFDDGQLACWGNNETGQLGAGNTANRGDGPGEMGDALPTIALGAGRTATAVSNGYSTCALLDNGQLKCWGYNEQGELGLGDTATRGDGPGEMGDALPAIDLGAGRTATSVSISGSGHACALLDDDTATCWGSGTFGALGTGDTADRGDDAGEMGEALPAVDLGDGRSATAVTTGGTHSCALLDDDTLKCWGWNLSGQLGLGDTADRGDGSGEMGDDLPSVDLPPRNDDFAAGQFLDGGAGTARGSNASADKEVGEPDHAGFAAADSSVWFRWTAPVTGPLTIDTFGSSFDTVLAVYTGATVGGLAPVAGNDDTDTLQSRVDFTATAGTSYRIAVAGFNGGSGPITLNWIQRPANDTFAAAAVLTGTNGARSGSNERASSEVGEPNHNPNGSSSGSVWYRWTAPAAGRTRFSTSGSSFDTVLAVYTGSTVDALTLVGNNDDQAVDDLRSRVVFTATAGRTYRIAVAGSLSSSGGDHGSINLTWTQVAACDGRPVTVALAFGDVPTAGPDVIRGTGGNDTVNGGGGADRICGGNGADTLTGGAGVTVDRLFGENGADTLRSGAGNDTLKGGGQNDSLFGEAGADRLEGGGQRDTCNGGPQSDTQTGCEVRSSIP